MIISACVFGYGDAGKALVEKFRGIPGYGETIRIHIVQISDLRKRSELDRNSLGHWKLKDQDFENVDLGISFGDDLVWLRENGWKGHDVIIDCSDDGDYFAEEIEYQVSTSPRMKLYQCTKLDQVDALIEKIKQELNLRIEQKAKWESSRDSEMT